MTIIEAIESASALKEHKCITRGKDKYKSFATKLKPNGNQDFVFISTRTRIEREKDNRQSLVWRPTVEDLLSNEWELCD